MKAFTQHTGLVVPLDRANVEPEQVQHVVMGQVLQAGQGQIPSRQAQIKAGIPSHVTADLNATSAITADEIRERMSGNICRCGAYSNIVDAISEVAGVKA